ncbi:MAG: flagellar biosynthesis protein FlhF, partial [Spirochaetales bacterium]|nr:flagellar biosynthesis protein FlhF [Spirochaetales bacterium]
VILTKLDETLKLGNVISVLQEKDAQIAYVTDGQCVPKDIQQAEASSLLRRLEGFKINESAMIQ